MADDPRAVMGHAEVYLENAEATIERGPRFYAVAFDEARHAVELACKTMLLKKTAQYPARGSRGHRIGGLMSREGLIPNNVDRRALNRTLDHHTRGSYGFAEEFLEEDVRDVIALGHALLQAARRWPEGDYWPPEPAELVD